MPKITAFPKATPGSRTDIFKIYKCGNNSARSSEQQDMQAVGLFSIPETIVVRGKIFLFSESACMNECNVSFAES